MDHEYAPTHNDQEPILVTAVTHVLAAAGYPLSVQPAPGHYTPGPFLDWRPPAQVDVMHWDDAQAPWYSLAKDARAANRASVTSYAAILTAAGLDATVQTYPDDRPYVAVRPSAAQGVA